MRELSDRERAVLLELQVALLGEITPNMRAVTAVHDDDSLHVDVYVDMAITEEDEEAVSLIETELLAAFPESHRISVEITQLPAPALIPKDRLWAYHRKEPLWE